MDHPASAMDDILTGTGFIAYLDANRLHVMTGYDALHEAARTIHQGIRRAAGHGRFAGLDGRLAARRITRPIRYAADLHLEAATAFGTAAAAYNATIGTPTRTGSDRGTFNPAR